MNPFLVATLAASAAVHVRSTVRNRRVWKYAVDTANENIELKKIVNFQNRQVGYLCSILDREEIEITDFDRIAMENL